MTQDARSELVQFIAHRVFYPVLMAKRDGTDRKRLAHIKEATHADIERFRNYASAEEVVANFKRDLNSHVASRTRSELRALNLPVIDDVREEFERKVEDLGVRLS